MTRLHHGAPHRAVLVELRIGRIDHHEPIGRRHDGLDGSDVERGSDRVPRNAEPHDVGITGCRDDVVHGKCERRRLGGDRDEASAHLGGGDLVEGIGGRRRDGRRPRPEQRPADEQDQLVRPGSRHDLLRCETGVARRRLSNRSVAGSRVLVECRGLAGSDLASPFRRDGGRVVVETHDGVDRESDGCGDLGRRRLPAIRGNGSHRPSSNLMSTASRCAVSPSASAMPATVGCSSRSPFSVSVCTCRHEPKCSIESGP